MGEHAAGLPLQSPPIRLNGAVHQPLVESVHGFDHSLGRIERAFGKRHPRPLARGELLNQDRHAARRHVEVQLLSVEKSSIRPQRRPDEPHVIQDRSRPADVDEGLVQPSERRPLGILTRGRGAHRDGPIGEALIDSRKQLGVEIVGQVRRQEHVADSEGRVPQLLPAHVLERFTVQLPSDTQAQARLGKVPAIGLDGNGEAARHGNPSFPIRASTAALPPTIVAFSGRICSRGIVSGISRHGSPRLLGTG